MSINLTNVNHIYQPGTPNETKALNDINLVIDEGEFVGLIGHTGSGKSTLIQHLNGLLKPHSGDIHVNGFHLTAEKAKLSDIRRRVGLVFQYPEYQLFEETIIKDVAFGPKNLGIKDKELDERVKWALTSVGLDESFYERSPFELSGGQKRRVAIAGVLAMKPEVLILDEPTAGLDPKGRNEILDLIKSLHAQGDVTVILVSHSMEDVARISNRLIVMNKGRIALDGTPKEVFHHVDELEAMGLAAPQIAYLVKALKAKGYALDDDIVTVKEALDAILSIKKGGKHD